MDLSKNHGKRKGQFFGTLRAHKMLILHSEEYSPMLRRHSSDTQTQVLR